LHFFDAAALPFFLHFFRFGAAGMGVGAGMLAAGVTSL
jgi:hypothetical protein